MNEIDVTEYSLSDWMEDLDRLVLARTGLSVHDLPAMPFWSAWDGGDTVSDFFVEHVELELEQLGLESDE